MYPHLGVEVSEQEARCERGRDLGQPPPAGVGESEHQCGYRDQDQDGSADPESSQKHPPRPVAMGCERDDSHGNPHRNETGDDLLPDSRIGEVQQSLRVGAGGHAVWDGYRFSEGGHDQGQGDVYHQRRTEDGAYGVQVGAGDGIRRMFGIRADGSPRAPCDNCERSEHGCRDEQPRDLQRSAVYRREHDEMRNESQDLHRMAVAPVPNGSEACDQESRLHGEDDSGEQRGRDLDLRGDGCRCAPDGIAPRSERSAAGSAEAGSFRTVCGAIGTCRILLHSVSFAGHMRFRSDPRL